MCPNWFNPMPGYAWLFVELTVRTDASMGQA